MISNRIIIVENNTISANEIRVAIEYLGYEDIRVVYFGKEVLKELNLFNPDIVLISINVDKINEIETANKIKQNFEFPIIYLIDKCDEKFIEKSLLTETDYYILKPLNGTAFNNTINIINKKLNENKEMLPKLMDNLPGMAYHCKNDQNWTMEFVSSGCYALTGYKESNIILNKKISYNSIIHPEDRSKVKKAVDKGLNKKKSYEITYRIITANNKIKYVWEQGRGIFSEKNELLFLEGLILDITQHKKTEKKLKRYNRALRVISECNQVLVRSNNETELLKQICNVLVDMGQYIFAWIGFAEDNKEKSVTPIVHSGKENGYLEIANLSWANNKRGSSTVGKSIRTGKTTIFNNMLEEPNFSIWRDEAHKRGYESVISLPLKINSNIIGMLAIYSSETDAFDTEEVKLLEELAYDLSYGVNALRTKKENEKIQKSLKESEERFRKLIQNSSDLIRILDKEGRIIFDSPSSARILGYPEGSLLGKSPLDFIHPDDYDKVKTDLQQVFDYTNPGIPTEFRIRKANGAYIPVESVSQNLTNVPSINGIVVTTHPIKERKEMEDALRKSEKRYRTLFEADPNYNILLDANGVILDVNDATINVLGLSKENMVGKHFTELKIFEDNINFYRERFHKISSEKIIKPFESMLLDKYGNIRHIYIQISPIRDNKNISFFLIIAIDITEQKEFENALKNSVKEKEVLVQEIHHRVKNNMQIISSLLNLQSRYVEDDEAVDVLKESQNRVKSMAMIHEKLYQSEDLTNINFKEYIISLISNLFYSYNIDKNKIKKIIDIEEIKLNMETAIPCGLIISELISNSLKYAFPNRIGGQITVFLKFIEEEYVLTISDNGIGLSDELDFKNTDSLGLQLVNSLINQIDGEIELNKNHGTTFIIRFKELKYAKRL
ncbi:PAS domain S-box protein [Methanobacterium spitsbergense]|uniref:PAS domain S-box protein n=1 Tax=Methanobacterium spitsbergense TaxID=2874285 RepID=A0A8T5UWQ0_9EURY|nr:PAS domain S-box protein [Methanobacterium spitsbergense]MBZ2165263.1 PAS domain S-box protein [Methanobacterium spitsbergense]